MKTSLTKNLDADQVKSFRQEFISSAFMRKQMAAVLDEKIESAYGRMRDRERYKDANWSLEQADSIGYIRAMVELKSLFLEK